MDRNEELLEMIKEMNVTGDIVQYKPPVKFDSVYRDRPCFHLSKSEFRKFIKRGMVPERISRFCEYYKTNEIYMKNSETKITFNFAKYKK